MCLLNFPLPRNHNFELAIEEIQSGKRRNPVEPLSRSTEFPLLVKSKQRTPKKGEIAKMFLSCDLRLRLEIL
jgi:hypothetical protein